MKTPLLLIALLCAVLSETAAAHYVKLTWDRYPKRILFFNVYRSEIGCRDYTLLAGNVRHFTHPYYIDRAVSPDKKYCYVVTAVLENGVETRHSHVVRAVIP